MATIKKRYLLIGGLAMVLTYGFFSPGVFSDNTRVGYIESEEITKKFQDFQEAQQRVDAAANAWKKEFEGMQSSLRMKEDSLEKYRLVWSAPEKTNMERAIVDLKGKIEDYWTHKFGPGNSEYTQLDDETMRPIYQKIFAAVQDVAKEDKYDFVFDKTGEVLLLYANPNNDLTRDVMDKLGIKDTGKTQLPQHQLPGHPLPGHQIPGNPNGQPGNSNGQPGNPYGQPGNPNGGGGNTPFGGQQQPHN
ncbi:MAG TPA: OmpH family outer membrane protein [Candidatus Kapabacteria bacterium]|nr:OmpH family outer membrane protein [Candidatus Kapabacteria bacterium]